MRRDERVAFVLRVIFTLVVFSMINAVLYGLIESGLSITDFVRDTLVVLWFALSATIAHYDRIKDVKILDIKEDGLFTKQGSILPYDKLEHFLLGGIVVSIFSYLFHFNSFLSFSFMFLISAYWELFRDGLYTYNGISVQGASVVDFVASLIGGLIIVLLKSM